MATGVTVRNINIAVKVDSKGAIAQLEQLKKALGGVSAISKEVGDAEKKVKEIQNEVAKIVKATTTATTDLNKIQEKTAKSAEEMAKGMEKSSKSASGFGKMVSRLLTYRLIRQALMYITNLFSEGTKKFKEFVITVKDARLGDVFTSLSYDAEILKLSLGSLSGELISMEGENLGGLSSTAMWLNTALSKLNATMNGTGYYYKVNEANVMKYVKALNEAKRAVMGFDEVNKVSGSETSTDGLYDRTELTGLSKLISDISSWLNSSEIGKWITTDSIGEFFTRLHNLFSGDFFDTEGLGIDLFKPFRDLVDAFENGEEWSGVGEDVKKPFEGVEGFFSNLGTVIFKPFRDIASIFSKKEDGGVSDIESTMTNGMESAINGLNTTLVATPIKPTVSLPDVETDFSSKIDSIIKSAASFSIEIGVGFNDFVTDLKKLLAEVATVLIATPLKVLLKLGLFKKSDSGETNIDDIYSALDGVSVGADSSANDFSYNAALREKFKVRAYANGGYPSAGSMFIAGEAGPEIVGSINGKTGVASGDEVTGIRTAVYSIGEAIVSAINNKDTNAVVRLDDGSIYKASQRGAKRVGNSLISFAN